MFSSARNVAGKLHLAKKRHFKKMIILLQILFAFLTFSAVTAQTNITKREIKDAMGSGTFINGKRDGLWSYFHENGRLYAEGNFHLDTMKGAWSFYYSNGQHCATLNFTGRYFGKWEDGIFNDNKMNVYSNWFFEGEVNRHAYLIDLNPDENTLKLKARVDGLAIIKDKNGDTLEISHWQNGVVNGIYQSYNKGKIDGQGLILNNTFQGRWTSVSLSGEVYYYNHYDDGVRNGIDTVVNMRTGIIKRMVEFRNGRKLWRTDFDESNGAPLKQYLYSDTLYTEREFWCGGCSLKFERLNNLLAEGESVKKYYREDGILQQEILTKGDSLQVTDFSETGDVWARYHYRNNTVNGWAIYYDRCTGDTAASGMYHNGKRTGTWITRYIPSMFIYANDYMSYMHCGYDNEGYETGLLTGYAQNKQQVFSGELRAQIPIGKWSYWYPNGARFMEIDFGDKSSLVVPEHRGKILSLFDSTGKAMLSELTGEVKLPSVNGYETGKIKNGNRDGWWTRWIFDFLPVETDSFKDGRLIGFYFMSSETDYRKSILSYNFEAAHKRTIQLLNEKLNGLQWRTLDSVQYAILKTADGAAISDTSLLKICSVYFSSNGRMSSYNFIRKTVDRESWIEDALVYYDEIVRFNCFGWQLKYSGLPLSHFKTGDKVLLKIPGKNSPAVFPDILGEAKDYYLLFEVSVAR